MGQLEEGYLPLTIIALLWEYAFGYDITSLSAHNKHFVGNIGMIIKERKLKTNQQEL